MAWDAYLGNFETGVGLDGGVVIGGEGRRRALIRTLQVPYRPLVPWAGSSIRASHRMVPRKRGTYIYTVLVPHPLIRRIIMAALQRRHELGVPLNAKCSYRVS